MAKVTKQTMLIEKGRSTPKFVFGLCQLSVFCMDPLTHGDPLLPGYRVQIHCQEGLATHDRSDYDGCNVESHATVSADPAFCFVHSLSVIRGFPRSL